VSEESAKIPPGKLTVVSLGLSYGLQLTREAEHAIADAERVAFVAVDGSSSHWFKSLRPDAVSLRRFYGEHENRRDAYLAMVDAVLGWLSEGQSVCFAAYGHAGFCAWATHESIRRARAAGYPADMIPGISTAAAFIADAGFDPAEAGWQIWEATRYLVHQQHTSPHVPLLLLQPSAVGVGVRIHESDEAGLLILRNALVAAYGADHRIVVYEAAVFPGMDPLLDEVSVADLPAYKLPPMSSLFVPALPAQLDERKLEMLDTDHQHVTTPSPLSLPEQRRKLALKVPQ